ncbi:peptide/nickel transport system permease protein [Aureimonas altamirensis DSM 21988]|jgi:peptide/nickel transport system permease protein|uniref:ABC-type dipeptide/oligopeptide/nickel transport system, permease component n=2 Tax=Aureimonas altamirensis TaxID=370622 RepID=A0A0P0YWY1_9HYPH|nr:ABC transporter permease [Aureimonas altamirensis]BAT25928.1 ABC-type dipeptide/oligopeptide/nickel transport system, permease component [Aureimonas altamirensis]SHI76000.1 peptide/nickel transport system permease protein [Aureimonas altamirensis DSM 21988]
MSGRLPHFVSTEPFDPGRTQALGTMRSERFMRASQGQLVWWRFCRHRLALFSLVFLGFAYASILISEFLAPYPLAARHTDFIFMPPQPVHLFHEGSLIGPFTYRMVGTLDMETLERSYAEERTTPMPLRFFCRGEPYSFWGLVEGNLHLVCPPDGGTLFLMGTDRLGRDMLSRVLYGARISLTIGLVGVALSFVLGLFFGGMAGYFGGRIDYWVQRVTEVLRSIPELPLWLALSAALPVTWSPLLVYFGITLILALLDWPSLARAVRSKLLSLREEDFTAAAVTMGARPARIIGRHLIPNFMSHLIASASLSIPTMILAETALSFLGLGLRPPITSWGVLLTEAQNIEAVALYPWLLFPMLPVIAVVLAFSFLGDGLRDALDPHAQV